MSAPRVTLKLATSLDARIALGSGESRWITSAESREQVHRLRAAHGAVLTGAGTVAADDPLLTARPGGVAAEPQPVRVILDSRLRTVASAKIFKAGPVLVYASDPDTERAAALAEAGAEVVTVPAGAAGRPDLEAVLADLGGRGIGSVMIEAGAVLAASVIEADAVDRIEWFRAPMLIGGDGLPVIAPLGLETLGAAPRYSRVEVRACGPDLWESYQRAGV